MKPSLLYLAATGLFAHITNAIDLDPNDPDSIKSATKIVAAGLRSYYTGDRPGDNPGNLPDPYFWWEAGAMFSALIDYWYFTGDDTYNAITTQAMEHQTGTNNAYMPQNQTSTLGNDDQAFWGMAAMTAAENKFPDSKMEGKPSWLALAQAVFNTQTARWHNGTCGGGLKWQIFYFNQGYDYKNTISNGAFFNIGARLAKYTGNSSYAEWAEKTWDWERSIGLISDSYAFYDGSNDEKLNCTKLDHNQWSYNNGVHLAGAAAMWNFSETEGNTEQAAVWRERLGSIINATNIFFHPEAGVMYEVACERNGKCNVDQRSFKAYLARWMGYAMQTAPWTRDTIMPLLQRSAIAAAKQCGAGEGQKCGLRWWLPNGENDGEYGVGEQMSALETMQNLLVKQVSGPAGLNTGALSQPDYSAGSDTKDDPPAPDSLSTGDRAGAGIITALVIMFLLGGSWWLVTDS